MLADFLVREIATSKRCDNFLERIFREHRTDVIAGKPFVLYGMGIVGQELLHTLFSYDLKPTALCDGDERKAGTRIYGIPVLSVADVVENFPDALILVSTVRYKDEIALALHAKGVKAGNMLMLDSSPGLLSFIRDGSQVFLSNMKAYCYDERLSYVLNRDSHRLWEAYDSLSDEFSKKLFVQRILLVANQTNMDFLDRYMTDYSQPTLLYGNDYSRFRSPESHFYFTNDVFQLKEGDVLVDVGAYDGDSVIEFVEACRHRGINYGHVYAFEPDEDNFAELTLNVSEYGNVSCYKLGLWSFSSKLSFASSRSEDVALKSSAVISDRGDVEIDVMALDELECHERITLIKMDPPSDESSEHIIRGAAGVIRKYRPTIITSIDKSLEALYERILLIKSIEPDYQFHIRHNSWCLGEVDLYAVPS